MKTYEISNNKTFAVNDDGERMQLSNFTARIIEEIRYIDNTMQETWLKIIGETSDDKGDPSPFPEITIQATTFLSMSWILPQWGVRAIVWPGTSIKDDLRTAIQTFSMPKVKTIYKHIGWENVNGNRVFLHSKGAITETGNKPDIATLLPPELMKYSLSPPIKKIKLLDAIAATLSLSLLAKPEISWPLIAATFAPLFGPVDFGVHLAGRTGTFKSEIASLFQSHYGVELDARNLPASWSSTPNALEALAYYAANSILVIDDFCPSGSSWQVRTYHTTADKIIRAQGNQAGRARLTDTSNLQTTMYPRGLILSTGEETPEGHSVRARLLIIEVSPGDISTDNLTKAQANRKFYPVTTAALIQYLAKKPVDLKSQIEKIRPQYINLGHTRTPTMLAHLIAVLDNFLKWCFSVGFFSLVKKNEMLDEGTSALVDLAKRQAFYLESADPCDLFLSAVRHVLAAGLGHFRMLNGGIPNSPTILGWTQESSFNEVPTYKSHGPCLGWCSWDKDELFIDTNVGYNTVKKVAGNEIAISKQTMFKRLKDAGMLTRTDDSRQRNSVRITAENHNRQVLSLCLSTILDTLEKPADLGTKPGSVAPPVSTVQTGQLFLESNNYI